MPDDEPSKADTGPAPSADDLLALSRTARAGRLLYALARKPDPVARLRRRDELRRDVQRHMSVSAAAGDLPEVLIVQLAKLDEFPEADRRLLRVGSSPWSKAEFKGLYDNGIEIIVAVERVRIRRGVARAVKEAYADSEVVYVACRIPFHRIAHIDWEPDPHYNLPRFYCRWRWASPVDRVVLYQGVAGGLAEVPAVRKYKPRRLSLWKRARLARQRRQVERRYERDAAERRRQGRRDSSS
jgi:hypothetical protein